MSTGFQMQATVDAPVPQRRVPPPLCMPPTRQKTSNVVPATAVSSAPSQRPRKMRLQAGDTSFRDRSSAPATTHQEHVENPTFNTSQAFDVEQRNPPAEGHNFDCFVSYGNYRHVPVPDWFFPTHGHVGAWIRRLKSIPVRIAVFGSIATGGLTYSILFFLSAWCDSKGQGVGTARPLASILTGIGFLVFWMAIVVLGYWTTCTDLLRWKRKLDSETDSDVQSRGRRQNDSLGVIQQLAHNVELSNHVSRLLKWWRHWCHTFLCAGLGYFSLSAFACVELLVTDRAKPNEFSMITAEFADLLPDRVGDGCVSFEATTTLLILTLIFYTAAGWLGSLLVTWFMMGVGLAAALSAAEIKGIARILDEDTWKSHARGLLSPIREIDESGMLRSDARDADAGLHVLRSKLWMEQQDRALEKLGDVRELKHLGYRLIQTRRDLATDRAAWEVEVRRPAVQIAKTTLPLLGRFGSCVLMVFVAFWTLLLSALPYVVATGNIFISLILTFFPVPLIIVAPVAFISSKCDRLLDSINDVRSEGLCTVSDSKVQSLRSYLMGLNKGQGLVRHRIILTARAILR